jgi:hypothetical protein
VLVVPLLVDSGPVDVPVPSTPLVTGSSLVEPSPGAVLDGDTVVDTPVVDPAEPSSVSVSSPIVPSPGHPRSSTLPTIKTLVRPIAEQGTR